MRCGIMTFFSVCGMLALVPVSRANVNEASAAPNPPEITPAVSSVPTEEQPYSAIWVRNVFDLKPPEEKPTTNKTDTLPPSNIHLIGIYTLFGKRACLGVQEASSPGKQANKEEYFNMSEGERHGLLEVMEINPTARTVKIKNEDVVSTITFETNKPAGPGAMASAGPHPPGGGFAPNFNPQHPPAIPFNNSMPAPLPNRMTRPSPSASASPLGGFQPGAAGYSTGYVQPTGAGLALGNSLFNQSNPSQTPNIPQVPSQDEQTATIALQHAAFAEEEASGKMPPLPPIPGMTDNAGANGENNNPTQPANNQSTVPPWLRNRTIPSFGTPIPAPPGPP